MGFLLGAFGKLAAGSRYRSLQARMMRVQSRLRSAARSIEKMEKFIDKQKKLELNNITMQTNYYTNSFQAQMYQQLLVDNGINLATPQAKLSDTQQQALSNYQQAVSQSKSNIEMQMASYKQMIEDKWDQYREANLEPLKDEEDSLQLEKDSLESQVQIAKADYEACQKMEQTDAKNLAPNYTGAA